MRSVAALVLMLAACGGPPPVPGWLGPDVHLVDGRWIGTETACGASAEALECRTVVEHGLATLAPDVRSKVTRAAVAALPTTFVTATGETRLARLGAGIITTKAVVVDQVDGTRRVIGLWCYLPYSGTGRLKVEMVSCDIAPLDDWRDGSAPAPIPPGGTVG